MEFKAFLKKHVIPGFFISTTFITLTMAVIGTLFEPSARFGYGILFSPLIYGLIAALFQLVGYSKKELTGRQSVVRTILHFALLEAGIMYILYRANALTNVSITVSLALSIIVIYVAVTLIMWLNDKHTTQTLNKALKELQQRNQDIE